MMILNGKELDLSFSSLDADDMERYDLALQHVLDRDEEYKTKKTEMTKGYEAIRYHCHTIFEFFNIVFGADGTDRMIFGEKTDLGVCFNALAEFCGNIGAGGEKVVEVATKYLASRITRESSEESMSKHSHTLGHLKPLPKNKGRR